jgi:integrase/recombinase XerD
MEGIRQDERFTNNTSPQEQQVLPETEDHEAAPLPFRIYLKSLKESKTQLFASQDRSRWFAVILKQLSESTLGDKELIEKYLRHMYRHMCKATTVDNVYRIIHSFATHRMMNTNRSLTGITRDDIEAFVEHEQDRGLKPSTVRLRLVVIRAFLRFLIDEGYLEHEVLTRRIQIKLPERLPRVIEPADVKQLLGVIDRVRDRALLLMLLRTGMRIGELLHTTMDEVNMQESKVTVYQAQKTGTGRVVYFSSDAKDAVAAWLRQRNPAAAFLFHGYGLQRLTYAGAREIFRKYLRKAGLVDKGYSLHCLRHTFASELLNAGMRLECLQKLLGHTSVEVTRRYARLTDKTREEEYFKAMEKIEKGEIDGHY